MQYYAGTGRKGTNRFLISGPSGRPVKSFDDTVNSYQQFLMSKKHAIQFHVLLVCGTFVLRLYCGLYGA